MNDDERRRAIQESGCHAPPRLECAPSLPRPRIDRRPIELLDWRDRHDRKTKITLRGGKPLLRDPRSIDSIVLHQTACVFGPAADRTKRLRRALKIGAHCTAFREGVVVLGIPFLYRGLHANALNAPSLGLEVEGRYPGLASGPRGAWDILDELTIETARAALTWLVEAAAAEGIEIRYLYAHRQSSSMRRGDPGELVWRAVALEHGRQVLGLRTAPARTWDSPSAGRGRPIPLEWDPSGVGRY